MIKIEVNTNGKEIIGSAQFDGNTKDICDEMISITSTLILEVMEKGCIPGAENKFIYKALREIESDIMNSEKMQEINKVRHEEIDAVIAKALKEILGMEDK